MKKVISMHIGGVLFNTEDSAYKLLEDYFAAIEKELQKQEDNDDTILDIQYRVAEHLNERRNFEMDSVILEAQVKDIISIMGAPKGFGSETVERSTAAYAATESHTPMPLLPTRKRLYRDEDDRVIAGVCSGLSYYLGISDPMWMRIIFVLLGTVSGGGWLFLYLLFWFILPKAISPEEKALMRSGQMEMDEMREWIDRELSNLKEGVSHIGRKFKR